MQKFTLPEGYTMEMLDAYAVQKERERRREWNRKHPEKVMEQRITASANLLRRNGYTVIPQLPPMPWDELTEHGILVALRAHMEQEGGQ